MRTPGLEAAAKGLVALGFVALALAASVACGKSPSELEAEESAPTSLMDFALPPPPPSATAAEALPPPAKETPRPAITDDAGAAKERAAVLEAATFAKVSADAGVNERLTGTSFFSAWTGIALAPPSTCGTKPLPDCPLQGWMKAHLTPPILARDFPALEKALLRTALLTPGDAYPYWVSIAKDGADAAHIQHIEAVKAACRGCHDQYVKKYRSQLRARPVGG